MTQTCQNCKYAGESVFGIHCHYCTHYIDVAGHTDNWEARKQKRKELRARIAVLEGLLEGVVCATCNKPMLEHQKQCEDSAFAMVRALDDTVYAWRKRQYNKP